MKKLLIGAAIAGIGASLASGAVMPTVKTGSVTDLGKVIVAANGKTLYHTMAEHKGKVSCTGACAKVWPPLLVAPGGKPVAGPGVSAAKLGVVKRPDGKMQVTYGGFGLYLYSGDTKAGAANGQQLENTWYAVSPAAKVVKSTSASTSGSSSSGGLGSGYTSTTPSPGYDPGYG
jgi:predicted lipoprotein with Yx(FWY)xxD motif